MLAIRKQLPDELLRSGYVPLTLTLTLTLTELLRSGHVPREDVKALRARGQPRT